MIVGLWRYEHYELSLASALLENNVEIIPCKLNRFFEKKFTKYGQAIPFINIFKRQINQYVLNSARYSKPDKILFWRPTYIYPKTLNDLTINYNV